jgi:hypothetical protein
LEEATYSQLPPTIRNHVTPSGIAISSLDKAEALKYSFYSLMPDADLTNIPSASYPTAMPSPQLIFEENSSVILKSHSFRAAGSDNIPFFV